MDTPNGIFNLTREFVKKSFNNESQLKHFDRTVYWLKVLDPQSECYLQVAAIGHDIERAFRSKKANQSRLNKGFLDKNDLKDHQEQGAVILGEFLKSQNCDDDFVKKVKHAVNKHEVGGDDAQNLLKDADSISFLENNSSKFVGMINDAGYKNIKDKIDWMYDRITSAKAKKLAKPFYDQIVEDLHKATNNQWT